jgi:gliding motility-associated-like protein
VTSAAGCVASTSINVIVTTPTTSASNTGPYCAGTTIQLNCPAATSYTWSGPAAFGSNLQNPTRPAATVAMAGTYTVIASIGTCTATATTNVVVNALPTPTATSNSPVCVGQPINFTGATAVSYTWTGPAAFNVNVQNPTIAIASMANVGTYTFTVSDVNGCKNSVTTNVLVNPLPVIAVNNPTVCVGQTINLTASGGVAYLWGGPLGYTANVQNPSIPLSTLGMSGQYTVGVMTAAGCTNIAVANVTVYPLPNPVITSNSPVCKGTTLNLHGTGGASYSWSGPNGFISGMQNPSITNVQLAASGVYTLIASAGTCSASTTSTITINPLPTPTITTNSPVCIGQAIVLNGGGGVSYSWTGPGGFNNTTASPTIAVSAMSNNGTYSLAVTDANGCVNSTFQNVIVNPQPVVAATGATVCQNANAILNATGGVTYSWTGPGGFSANGQNPTVANIPLNGAGLYTVVVTDANTCTNTAVAIVQVHAAPTPSIQTNSPICINNVLNLAGTGGVTYNWTGPNGFFSSTQSATINANTTAYTGVYFLTVADNIGCTATTSVNAVVNGIPNLSIKSLGANTGCVPLCVNLACVSSATIQSYNWSLGNGATGSTPTVQTCYNTAGIYTVNTSVVDSNGCVNAVTYTVDVYPKPTADFNYSPLKPIENTDNVIFTDASYGATIAGWSWYFNNTAQFTSTLQNPTFIYADAGEYPIVLVVKTDHGCMDTVIKSIIVGEDFGIWVPNTFTPNGDGLNDIFYAKGYGITSFKLTVFDRWGAAVFTATDINSAWDGTLNGKALKEDTYSWLINVTSVFGKSKDMTGHVTLIR